VCHNCVTKGIAQLNCFFCLALIFCLLALPDPHKIENNHSPLSTSSTFLADRAPRLYFFLFEDKSVCPRAICRLDPGKRFPISRVQQMAGWSGSSSSRRIWKSYESDSSFSDTFSL